jgi:hypothetical protein
MAPPQIRAGTRLIFQATTCHVQDAEDLKIVPDFLTNFVNDFLHCIRSQNCQAVASSFRSIRRVLFDPAICTPAWKFNFA